MSGSRRFARRDKVIVALAVESNRWIREEAQARGWRLVNIIYGNEEFPRDVFPRGALVSYLPGSSQVTEMRKRGCVAVRLGLELHPGDSKLPAVLPDRFAEGKLAAEHFHEREFRHVGYFGSDPWGEGKPVYEGLLQRATELSLECHLARFKSLPGENEKQKMARKKSEFIDWIKKVPKPIGLLAASGSYRAASQCGWIERAGLSVPSDVAVLAAGSAAHILESFVPAISDIPRDDELQARVACELLDKLMAGAPAPKKPILIPPKAVIERESTDVLATPDRLVADVLRFMWDHLDMDLSVEQIADEAGITSRHLARRFHQALGRTVTEELLRKRLEEVKILLRRTSFPVVELAPAAGFRSIHYLHRKFREAFGMTPLEYRKMHKQ